MISGQNMRRVRKEQNVKIVRKVVGIIPKTGPSKVCACADFRPRSDERIFAVCGAGASGAS